MPRFNGFRILNIICLKDLLSYLVEIKEPIVAKHMGVIPIDVILWGTHFIDPHTIRFYYKLDDVSNGFRTIDAQMAEPVPAAYVEAEAQLAEYMKSVFVKHYRLRETTTQTFTPITVSYIPSRNDGVIVLAVHGFEVHILHWDQLQTFRHFDNYFFSESLL